MIMPLSLSLQNDQTQTQYILYMVGSHAMSVSAGEVEEDGLKVEGEEGVVRIGMGAQ